MKKQAFLSIACVLVVGCVKTPHVATRISAPPIVTSSSSSATSSVPPSLLITVPFAPQAPSANWDALHEEACEEASLLLVLHYWTQSPLTRETMERELQDLVAWEHAHGFADDVTTAELADIARQKFRLKATVDTNVSAANIERYLREGKPVIIPAAGRLLGNPNFSGEGPWYHMLVITGYDDTHFITNDPGTKRGENFVYEKSALLNAVHDWTGTKEAIASGAKSMLIVER